MTLQDFAYLGNPITEYVFFTDLVRTVIDMNGNTVATLKAEQYMDEAELDYAAVLRSIQQNEGSAIVAAGCHYTWKEYALQVIATIGGTQYIFIRGVTDFTYASAATFKYLTNMPELRHYSGYPLTISYLISNDTAKSWSVRMDGEEYESSEALANMAQVLRVHATSDITNAPQNITHVDSIVVGIGQNRRRFVYHGTGGPTERPYVWKGID